MDVAVLILPEKVGFALTEYLVYPMEWLPNCLRSIWKIWERFRFLMVSNFKLLQSAL